MQCFFLDVTLRNLGTVCSFGLESHWSLRPCHLHQACKYTSWYITVFLGLWWYLWAWWKGFSPPDLKCSAFFFFSNHRLLLFKTSSDSRQEWREFRFIHMIFSQKSLFLKKQLLSHHISPMQMKRSELINLVLSKRNDE